MRHTKNKRDVFLIGLIENYQKLYNVSDDALALALNMSRTTWYRRKASPGELKLHEVDRLCKRLQIPVAEIKDKLF